MTWAISPHLLADIVIPTPILVIVTPLLAAMGVWWLITRMDRIAHHVFPHLAWEHSLGWFNIKAERRANAAFRWIRRGLNLLLFDALVIMLWTASKFPTLQGPRDQWASADLISHVSLFILCVGVWVLYLGCGLLPGIRARHEMGELRKFRSEMEEYEQDGGTAKPKARVHAALAKPSENRSVNSMGPNRLRRFDQPGG